MLQVQDLNLEKDILPLFDYTNNDQAAMILLQLLQEVPDSVEEIYNRQEIIKGCLQNWKVLGNFSYQRLYLREVQGFLDDVTTQRLVLERNRLKAVLRLSFSEEERYRLRSQSAQLILFFHRIYTHYFSRIKLEAFPANFQQRIKAMTMFLQKLQLKENAHLLTEDKFTVASLVKFTLLLAKLERHEVVAFWKNLALFEAYFSIAKGVTAHQLIFPVFDDTAFALEKFYHPLLKKPVRNSLQLSQQDNVVLLTGPNMSGKSTLLRAVGLCVYLAHIGFGVPATVCKLPYFDTIAISINANDSLRDGYSHFMTEIQNIKAVALAANTSQKCFAVFDEIFRGTNIDDALDITRTTVNGLARFSSSFFFISTHLLQLKDNLAAEGICKYNIACELTDGYPQFSYKLQEGWSDLRIGKIIFEKEGLQELFALPY